MAKIIFRFVEPCSLVGKIITWWLNEPFSHMAIIIGDVAYSAQVPFVAMLPASHKSVAMPPRTGVDVVIEASEEERLRIKEWCESHIGRSYDILSILGWMFGLHWLQSRKNNYCFEYGRKALEHMGWLEPTDDLVKGQRLLDELNKLAKDRNS